MYETYLEKIIKNLNLGKVRKLNRSNIKDTLSKGEQQKIQLARIMLAHHSLILLDEVLSGLDEKIKKKIIYKIREKSKDKIIVIISHDHEIQRVCNEIILMPDKNILKKNKSIHKS